jgi:hypothetical protein
LAFASSAATAGTVRFEPSPQSVEPNATEVVFDVYVETSTFTDFDTVTLLIGSDAALDMSFVYADSFVSSASLPPAAPAPFRVFTADIAAQGNRFTFWQAPLLVGTLTVQTAGLEQFVQYDVFVDAGRENDAVGTQLSTLQMGAATPEPLTGMGSFTIVPEPATLLMLGIGGAVAAYRRRK